MEIQTLRQINLAELYDQDEYLWIVESINLLQNRQLQLLDIEHLVETLKQLGRSQFNQVRSLLKQIIIHLLLLQYWETEYEYNHRHWQVEIINFRDELQQNLTTSLKNKLIKELESIYRISIRLVIKKTDLPSETFSAYCPYTWDQLVNDRLYPLINSRSSLVKRQSPKDNR